MRLPTGTAVGVCSHTGLVRGANEDDYLLAVVPGANGPTVVAAIADGMGGVAGGAEASRTALRALVAQVVDGGGAASLAARMQQGFRSAGARVFEAATAVPALRDMGTTLTALAFAPGQAALGHIGDSRLYRVRRGAVQLLTEDHVLRQRESMLTRCIGGGQIDCEPDQVEVEIEPGDRFVLVTDGVWNVVPPAEFERLTNGRPPTATAEALVQRALDHGGPDNATCVVVDVAHLPVDDSMHDVDLPRHERPEARVFWPRAESLRPPPWPWLVLVAAVLVLIYSGLRWAGLDPLQWLVDLRQLIRVRLPFRCASQQGDRCCWTPLSSPSLVHSNEASPPSVANSSRCHERTSCCGPIALPTVAPGSSRRCSCRVTSPASSTASTATSARVRPRWRCCGRSPA